MADRFGGDVTVAGNLVVEGALPAIARTNLTQESYSSFEIPLTDFRVWDAVGTALGSAGSDDLGITSGAFATGIWYLTAGSLGSAGATTRYARVHYQVPMNYVAGQNARLALYAGITGTTPAAASVSCTADVEVYKFGSNVLISGSDLVSSSAQSINSTTFATVTLDLTATSLNPGDWLDIRVAVACNDGTASAANVVPAIAKVQFQAHTKG